MPKQSNHQSLILLIVLAFALCVLMSGNIPILSPNRKNLAPWDKLPAGNGITYLNKYSGRGVDPMYLAEISYTDQDDFDRVIDTFNLVPEDERNQVLTFTNTHGKNLPSWFTLEGITQIYVFPAGHQHDYASNLWVNTDKKIMILERTWW